MSRYTMSDNKHPNTNGSPWGAIYDADGVEIARYSGWEGKKRARQMVDLANRAARLRDAATTVAGSDR